MAWYFLLLLSFTVTAEWQQGAKYSYQLIILGNISSCWKVQICLDMRVEVHEFDMQVQAPRTAARQRDGKWRGDNGGQLPVWTLPLQDKAQGTLHTTCGQRTQQQKTSSMWPVWQVLQQDRQPTDTQADTPGQDLSCPPFQVQCLWEILQHQGMCKRISKH